MTTHIYPQTAELQELVTKDGARKFARAKIGVSSEKELIYLMVGQDGAGPVYLLALTFDEAVELMKALGNCAIEALKARFAP